MLQHIHIYEMPEENKHFSFQLYEVSGKTIQNKTYPHKTDLPHRHNYYEICIFINGGGKHEIDFKTYPIESNSIHFLTPGQVHLISRDDQYRGYLLVFNREFYSMDFQNKDLLFELPFFNNPGKSPVLSLSEPDFSDLLNVISGIKKELKQHHPTSHDILRAYLHIFLLKSKTYFNSYHHEEMNNDDPEYILTGKFKNLVEKNFNNLHLVKEYAEILGQSAAALNKMVKRVTGKNASEVITNRIVLEAKRLLIYTNLTNKEIAYRLKYEDPSYFTRTFKKKIGVTPSDFRKKMNKKYQN